MEKGKLNLTNILLSIIGGLLSLSVAFLNNMNHQLNVVITTQAVQEVKIQSMQQEQNDLKNFYQEVLKEAKKEDGYTFENRRK